MFRRIIVGLKFSTAGKKAFSVAAGLARVHQARLLAFHALDYRLMAPQTSDETILRTTREAERRFELEFKPLLSGYRQYAFNAWEADPSVEICLLARETDADLIVIGCHQREGRPGVTRLGQVGLSVLQGAPCMVLLVPCPDETASVPAA